MAQILAVKDQLISHDFDDIIGIFEDTHKFSDDEKLTMNIYQVRGYTREQVVQFLNGQRKQRSRVYRSKTTEWTTERPEQKTAWKHVDSKWYFLEKLRLEWTVKDWTIEDKDKIASDQTPSFERLQIMSKIKNKIEVDTENFIEVPNIAEVVRID